MKSSSEPQAMKQTKGMGELRASLGPSLPICKVTTILCLLCWAGMRTKGSEYCKVLRTGTSKGQREGLTDCKVLCTGTNKGRVLLRTLRAEEAHCLWGTWGKEPYLCYLPEPPGQAGALPSSPCPPEPMKAVPGSPLPAERRCC